jgi:hypothetical protein
MLFSDQIFEAIVVKVSYESGTCSISPLDSRSTTTIDNVPMPSISGSGSSGIFYGITIGSRIIAAQMSTRGRDTTVILGFLPTALLLSQNISQNKSIDLPSGLSGYPSMANDRMIVRGGSGVDLSLSEGGNAILKTANGGGIYLYKNEIRSSLTIATEDIIEYSNAMKLISGPVRRMTGVAGNIFPKPSLSEMPLFVDPKLPSRTTPIGFFYGDRPLRRSYNKKKRNPEISEYRLVINEFSTDYMFTGFDDEVERIKNDKKLYQNSETFKRNREQGNTLHLAEHELIEIIGGNLVDINGNILDINYRPLSYGSSGNKVPNRDMEINYDRSRRVSRRGIGYHFQLSTNTRASEPSSSSTNFVVDMDKEGILKLNIPASTDTGNIPYSSSANYTGTDDNVDVSLLNQSVVEPIPVTLRDEKGQPVFPNKKSQAYTHRKTGVRYSSGEESSYFPTINNNDQPHVRINTTKYHNMYATAERLIANTVRVINIPSRFSDENGNPEGLPIGKPFEVPLPDSLEQSETLDASFRTGFPAGSTDYPTFMSVVAVDPGPPAIYTGGGEDGVLSNAGGIGTVVAGRPYVDDDENPPYSNSFNSSITGDEVSVEITDGNEKAVRTGGKSANLNFEGSIEASIGKDNFDQKSIILDTAGSIVAWFGKDKNNRSAIIQTDGDVLFNIGGSYSGEKDNMVMNKGRFDLRVNIVDKKFVSTQFNDGAEDNGGNPGSNSDFMISISEDGFIIAGMKKDAPMIIRNDGPLLIESSSNDVIIKGVQVKTVGPKGVPKDEPPATKG